MNDQARIALWQILAARAEFLREQLETTQARQRELVAEIEEHVWILECGGRLTFVGTKEEVWDYAKACGAEPITDCGGDGYQQFKDGRSGLYAEMFHYPVWGNAFKIKPVGSNYVWEKLSQIKGEVL